MRANTLILLGWLLNLVWIIGIFAAPLALVPGTVQGLHGRANMMDYGEVWVGLQWFPRVVYALGDLQCHQMEHRSWTLNANQMPIDVRMTMAYIGAAVALPITAFLRESHRMRDLLVQLIPSTLRGNAPSPRTSLAISLGIVAAAFAPALVDVAIQMAGVESTNPRRAWTGLLLGGGVALLVASCVKSLLAQVPERETTLGVAA